MKATGVWRKPEQHGGRRRSNMQQLNELMSVVETSALDKRNGKRMCALQLLDGGQCARDSSSLRSSGAVRGGRLCRTHPPPGLLANVILRKQVRSRMWLSFCHGRRIQKKARGVLAEQSNPSLTAETPPCKVLRHYLGNQTKAT